MLSLEYLKLQGFPAQTLCLRFLNVSTSASFDSSSIISYVQIFFYWKVTQTQSLSLENNRELTTWHLSVCFWICFLPVPTIAHWSIISYQWSGFRKTFSKGIKTKPKKTEPMPMTRPGTVHIRFHQEARHFWSRMMDCIPISLLLHESTWFALTSSSDLLIDEPKKEKDVTSSESIGSTLLFLIGAI